MCASEAKEDTEHTEEGDNREGKASASLGVGLEREDRVDLGEIDELEDLAADKLDGVLLEGDGSLNLVLLRSLLFDGLLDGLLDEVRLLGELTSVLDGVANVDVVEEDVLRHGPELDTDTANGHEALDGGAVLEVVGVGDLAGSPLALVRGVVDHGCEPLALVVGVGLVGALPLAAAGSLVTLGVANGGRDPVTILLVIPLLGLLSICRIVSTSSFTVKGICVDSPGSGMNSGSSSSQPSGFTASSSGIS